METEEIHIQYRKNKYNDNWEEEGEGRGKGGTEKREVKEVNKYKFLGNSITSKGERQIYDIERSRKESRGNNNQHNNENDEKKYLGKSSTEKTGVPTLINNLECWTKFEKWQRNDYKAIIPLYKKKC